MKLDSHNIKPEKINTPIQLLAVWFVALLLIIGFFFTAANHIKKPDWISPLLVISGIIIVFIFIILVFLMQTKYRPEMLSGNEYLIYIEKRFNNFSPENLNTTNKTLTDNNIDATLEELRIKSYQENKGIFLIHYWRPSTQKGQKADIRIKLMQHGQGPLSLGQIKYVEYELGRKFFNQPIIKYNKNEDFALDVSAYAPMLCIAKIKLKDNNEIILKRYIDFDY